MINYLAIGSVVICFLFSTFDVLETTVTKSEELKSRCDLLSF